MHKTSFFVEMMLFFSVVFFISCSNVQSDKQVADTTKAAVESVTDSLKKSDSTGIKKEDAVNMPVSPRKIKEEKNSAPAIDKTKKSEKKITEKNTPASDTVAVIKTHEATISKNASAAVNTPANNQPAIKPVTSDAVNRPFVSKYGVIPRDANENNLSVFFNTFPDKNTLIKVNFDGPPNDEMNSVKTQILKVLKKSGYVNVSDHSETIEPKRMPKDIHYELQHDGSVVFWVPIANQE